VPAAHHFAAKCQFFNAAEWEKIRAVYPDLSVFRTAGTR